MKRVALINMPWVAIDRPSIALGMLKRVLRREKIAADVFYLNIRLARLMPTEVFQGLSQSYMLAEWIFSQHLFGPYGTGELKSTLSEAMRDCYTFCDADRYTIEKLYKQLNVNFEEITREVIPKFIDGCLSEIDWSRYGVVGFTSVFAQQLGSLLLARRIKERYPEIKTVFGGANVHGVMGQAAIEAFDWIDYVVDGEGEPVFPALVRNILEGRPFDRLPGVSFREGDRVVIHQGLPPTYRLDNSPIPDYSDYFRELRNSGMTDIDTLILFESSRGCWWGEKAHCTFCGLNGNLMKYRKKSSQKVAGELITQSKRYNSFLFEAVDNILDMESFSNFLPEFGEKKLDINLFYEVKSSLNKEQVRILRKSGVICIQPGIESLNTEVLKLMRKGVTAIQNIQVLKFCREMEIQVTWSILYGFPGERRHHYEETLATIPFLTHLFPPSAVPRIVVQRFSPYHFDAERLGIRNVKPPAMYGHIYPESKVNLNNLAYFFDYTLDESQEDPATYIKPVKSAVNRWKKAFHVDKVSFTYRLGPGFIELQDTRPLESSSRLSKPRRTILRGVERDVYLLCDSIRSFKDICNHVSEKTGGEWTTDRTRELLDRMLADKLMFSEKDRFLSLATAARPRTSPANGSHDNIRNGNGHRGPVKIVKIDQSVSEIDRARSE